jgi:hypothetical protein
VFLVNGILVNVFLDLVAHNVNYKIILNLVLKQKRELLDLLYTAGLVQLKIQLQLDQKYPVPYEDVIQQIVGLAHGLLLHSALL